MPSKAMTATPQIPADMAVSPKFAAFNLTDVNYKEVNSVGVPASILIPKDIKPGKHPVLVRWHGGCFITGHRFYPDWFGQWIIDFALSHSAIIISPDYRLLPEATGLDILQDVRDFYNWLATPSALSTHLPEGVIPDLDHLLVTGESAGGWLALQSGLLPSSRQKIAAVISHYPMIDMRAPHYTEDYHKDLFTPTAPQLDRSILANYMKDLDRGKVETSAIPPDRVPLVISALQQGKFGEWFGSDKILYPIEVIEEGGEMPPTWVLHGKGDTVIPVEGTRKFEQVVRDKLGESAKVHFTYEEGDHGFDNAPGVGLDTAWVKKGLEFIGEYWPAK